MENLPAYLNNISLITYLIVFIAGLAVSFTPCVYPLIPIVVGVIGSSKEKSRRRNFILSLSYVLGMALTFSLLGMAAAMTGRLFGELQTNPIVYIVVGAIIILFALALLGIIPLPLFLLNRAGLGRVGKGGSALAVFFMGFASGFVAAPCTAAVLGALLTYVATTQNVVFGFTLLFTFATGMGVLLLLIGTFTGILTTLPKLETAMRLIQKVLAFAMIILGGYFIFKGLANF